MISHWVDCKTFILFYVKCFRVDCELFTLYMYVCIHVMYFAVGGSQIIHPMYIGYIFTKWIVDHLPFIHIY